jgi:hypothetical protein
MFIDVVNVYTYVYVYMMKLLNIYDILISYIFNIYDILNQTVHFLIVNE